MLLVGAGLLIKSFMRLRDVSPGSLRTMCHYARVAAVREVSGRRASGLGTYADARRFKDTARHPIERRGVELAAGRRHLQRWALLHS